MQCRCGVSVGRIRVQTFWRIHFQTWHMQQLVTRVCEIQAPWAMQKFMCGSNLGAYVFAHAFLDLRICILPVGGLRPCACPRPSCLQREWATSAHACARTLVQHLKHFWSTFQQRPEQHEINPWSNYPKQRHGKHVNASGLLRSASRRGCCSRSASASSQSKGCLGERMSCK